MPVQTVTLITEVSMSDKPKQDANVEQARPDDAAKKPQQPLSDADLKKVIGGEGGYFARIKGPSWVKTMAYRKAEWDAEPARERSVVELHKELAAGSAGVE
jgi:hypothetical protein